MSRVRALGMALVLLTTVASCGAGGTDSVGRARTTTTSVVPGTSHTAAAESARSSPSSTQDEHPPPYIAKVVWMSLASGRSLQIYPTANGRVALADGAEDEAWHEVLRQAPDAATAGMRAQFDCHWAFARLAEPNKVSWNLEPWRPVVSGQRMYDTRCNPGGPEV